MKWPFKKQKFKCPAVHLLEKSFPMMYSNIGLSFCWTLPLKCQYSVFRFLANSVSYWWIPFYFPHFNMWQVKKSVLTDPNFYSPKNHNSIQVHMVHEHFISINLVLTAVKLFNIGNLTLFSSQFTCRLLIETTPEVITFRVSICGKYLLSPYWNPESNYFPHFWCGK